MSENPLQHTVTTLLHRWTEGDASALDALMTGYAFIGIVDLAQARRNQTQADDDENRRLRFSVYARQ